MPDLTDQVAPTLWIDVETTSLDPHRGAIIEIGLIFDVEGVPSVWSYESSSRVAPPAPAVGGGGPEISTAALAVSGANAEEIWFRPDARDYFWSVYLEINRLNALTNGAKVRLAGHNVAAFDSPFFREALRRYRIPSNWLSHRVVDTMVLAGMLQDMGVLPRSSVGLAGLADHYGVEFTPHNALSDAQAARTIYHRMQADLADRLASAKEGR